MTQRNTSRDGVALLTVVARQLCRAVQLFGPVLRIKYADTPSLIAALTAAEETCRLLPNALADVTEFGGQNEPLIDDPFNTPGILGGVPSLPPVEP
jgi:hypothetical protein